MRKIKHVYEAEEQGVWATDAHLDATMSPSTKHGLSRSVSEISGESPEKTGWVCSGSNKNGHRGHGASCFSRGNEDTPEKKRR